MVLWKTLPAGHWNPAGHIDTHQYDHDWTRLLSNRRGDPFRQIEIQDHLHREVCLQSYWNLLKLGNASHAFSSW